MVLEEKNNCDYMLKKMIMVISIMFIISLNLDTTQVSVKKTVYILFVIFS